MPRPRKIQRPVAMRIYLPEDLYARVNLMHYSEAQGRVPYGAISEWFEKLARQELEKMPTAANEDLAS